MSKRHRDAVSGETVSPEYAEQNPKTTVSETIKKLNPEFLKNFYIKALQHANQWHEDNPESQGDFPLDEFCEKEAKHAKTSEYLT